MQPGCLIRSGSPLDDDRAGEEVVKRLAAGGEQRDQIAEAVHNAGVILGLRDSHGGLAAWLDAHHPPDKPDWVKLFKKTFRFTGGEITAEFLMSLGYLPGAHRADCPVHARILALDPPWSRG